MSGKNLDIINDEQGNKGSSTLVSGVSSAYFMSG